MDMYNFSSTPSQRFKTLHKFFCGYRDLIDLGEIVSELSKSQTNIRAKGSPRNVTLPHLSEMYLSSRLITE
jgi:hypothetical protein